MHAISHPERESAQTLAMIRQNIGEYHYLSQYQQSPTPIGGAMIKLGWLQYFDPADSPAFSRIVQSWDTANKAGKLNDHSVGTTWGVSGKNYYLLDVYRKKVNYPDLKRDVVDRAKRFNARSFLSRTRRLARS